jgi:hypothetical protein
VYIFLLVLQYGDQDMVKQATIAWLDVLVQESLQLIYDRNIRFILASKDLNFQLGKVARVNRYFFLTP